MITKACPSCFFKSENLNAYPSSGHALSLIEFPTKQLSVPAFSSSSELLTTMGEFARQHPHVALSLSFTDHPVDLIDDVCDLNTQVGWLDDASKTG